MDWISINDAFPKVDKPVLAVTKEGDRVIVKLVVIDGYPCWKILPYRLAEKIENFGITHWLPLPPVPKEE